MWWQVLKSTYTWWDSQVFQVPAKKISKSLSESAKQLHLTDSQKQGFQACRTAVYWTAYMLQSGETSYQTRELMSQLVLEAGHPEMSLLWIKTYGGHNLCTSLPSVQWWTAMSLTKVRLISLDSCWSPRQYMLSICCSLYQSSFPPLPVCLLWIFFKKILCLYNLPPIISCHLCVGVSFYFCFLNTSAKAKYCIPLLDTFPPTAVFW